MTVAKSFVNNFILKFGIPKEIVTDQGTEFLANVFKETAKLLGIAQLTSTAYHHQTLGSLENTHKHLGIAQLTSTAYHHQTLGSLENTHKHLGSYLRIQTAKFPYTWSTWIPYWCFSFNNTVHTATKYTPYELVFGQRCNLPTQLINNTDPIYNFEDYVNELKFRLQSAWQDAKYNLIESKMKRKERFDKHSSVIRYKFNDKVLLRDETGNKLQQLYKGPYKVIKEDTPNVTLKIKNKLVKVHKDRVKKYIE
ncbi:hypothetical protein QE152_g4345 [Popillia japonica]|uniref:Integrase catalytic domain-containing protein n=1 Tax=Popillia japonica TaxID=7064 RepID=A0AAW1MVR8_POPJA